MKTALITGINGQAGAYLAHELLLNDYKVVGLIRRSSSPNLSRLQRLNVLDRVIVEEGDITDVFSITQILEKHKPTHIFNAAAQSHVHTSFSQPKLTFEVTALGVLNMLEAVKKIVPESRFLQFSSSEMFGDQVSKLYYKPIKFPKEVMEEFGFLEGDEKLPPERFQDENTRMNPQSPYAVAKLAGYNLTRLYRGMGLFASNVIMFNYESAIRGENFVTQKIAKYVQSLSKALNTYSGDSYIPTPSTFSKLRLGNIHASRDWGFCGDYMRGCRLVLEHSESDDFVLATGETHTVEEYLHHAFSSITQNWKNWVEIDPALIRPAEVPYLCGKADKAKKVLGWEPKVKFADLVLKMVSDVV